MSKLFFSFHPTIDHEIYDTFKRVASLVSGICHPQPADMIFLLDSSISQTEENFKKQLDFVSNFTDHVLIGPNDTQVSIITFSFEAYLEFDVSRYNNNATLKAAIQSVQFKPGITRTDKALQKAKEVAENSEGRTKNGLIQSTTREAYVLKTSGLVKGIAAIGIGKEVSHQELKDIASSSSSSSSSSYVFSLDNFDSLYTIVTQLVHITCQECSHSAVSDVILMIDNSVNTSYTESKEDFLGLLKSISSIIEMLDTLGNEDNDTHISLASFSDSVRPYVNLLNDLSKSEFRQTISRIIHKDSVNSNIYEALHYINE
ncbi:hypothetical protein CHS0354_021394 [Potamilus streckersoni]|uniref:VWFA domain-containing protein n=1 Tax=Potamilus streckersoni TaxID=2493646 RepID=A0AAE0S1I4_9BIVA|nr:hypothetical protein CHS0354_021394 [Potamilus streckersoni]